MSLLPGLIALLIVMLLSTASSRLVAEGTWSATQRVERVKVRERAERALSQATDALATGAEVVEGVVVEQLASSPAAESGELPLLLHRVTVTVRGRTSVVKLQADYAVDGCESPYDDPCRAGVRRIAWRELAD